MSKTLTSVNRGDIISNHDLGTYVDINGGKPLEYSGNQIKLANAVGLYHSHKEPGKLIFVKFNAAHPSDPVYIDDQNLRLFYTKTKYLSPQIVSRFAQMRTLDFHSLTATVGKWDPSVKLLSYENKTVRLTLAGETLTLELSAFSSLLSGNNPKAKLSFANITFQERDKQLYTTLYIQAEPWDLGIGNPEVLFAVAYIITTRLSNAERQDPVKVARFCADFIGFVQGTGRQGLMQGKWTEGQAFGPLAPQDRVPMHWQSSAEIIRTYRDINGGKIPDKPIMFDEIPRPVRYGQCFIFGCLLQTFMRVVGIGCRAVRTEDSSHDSIRSFIIACKEGEEVPNWNFHVWNEVWMSRRDLEVSHPEFSRPGWQVLDATPQGLSYQSDCPQTATGPCPVAAIRKLRSDVPFDAGFIIGEVNAVVATYMIRTKKETCGVPSIGGRTDDWFLYDVGRWRNGTSILCESYDGGRMYFGGMPIAKLSQSRQYYVDETIDPRLCITSKREYTPKVALGISTNRKLRISVDLTGSSGSDRYLIAAIVSYDYHDGPLLCESINTENSQVREFTRKPTGTFELSWDNPDTQVTPICTKDGFKCSNTHSDTHKLDCATTFTLRIFIKLKAAGELIDSKASILIYQWVLGKWKTQAGL